MDAYSCMHASLKGGGWSGVGGGLGGRWGGGVCIDLGRILSCSDSSPVKPAREIMVSG